MTLNLTAWMCMSACPTRFTATSPLFARLNNVNISRKLTLPDQQLLHRAASTSNKFAITVSMLDMIPIIN